MTTSRALGSFRQNLKSVLRAVIHRVKDTEDEFVRNIVVKKVTHRIDEDNSRGIPSKGLVNGNVIEKHVAIPSSELVDYLKVRGLFPGVPARFNVGGRHGSQALCRPLRVAVAHPATFRQPTTGFHVESVHSIVEGCPITIT